MQYNKMKLSVGIFVIILFGVIIGTLYFFALEKGLFDKRYSYYFSTKSAQSFSVGMPLKFSGFEIAMVDDIALQDDGTVMMRFSVNQKNQKWISEGSTLKLLKPLIGSAYIEVDSQIGREPLAPKSHLSIVLSDDINDIIAKVEPIVAKIVQIIDNVESITAYLSSDDSELRKILQNLNTFSAKLAKNDALLTTVTGDEKSTKSFVDSLNTLHESMQNLNAISANINTMSGSFDKDILQPTSQGVGQLNAILKDVKAKLEAINGTVNAVGSYDNELLQLKEEIGVAIQKSNIILEKVDGIITEDREAEVILP